MDPATDAALVERVRGGDATAFAPLFERWYDRVYNVARGVVRRPELAADVAQDAFVSAWQQLDRLDDVNAFGGWLLRITRNRALDALRREGHSSPTDDETVVALRDRDLPSPVAAMASVGPAEAAEVHEREQLLWAAAAALGERDASLLDLHLRHGLSPAELAEDLGVTPNHAHQLVHRLRNRLGDAIGAFLLWNRGSPHCPVLAGRTGSSFDADVASTVKRHIRSCTACSEERRRHTDPTKLFAAVPFALAPLAFRGRAAFALEQAGAPMPPELTTPTRQDTTPPPQEPNEFAPRSADSADDPPPDPEIAPVRSASIANGHGLGPTDGQRRRWAAGRIAAVAALVLILIGGSTVLMVNSADAPDGAASLTVATTSPVTTEPSTTAPSSSSSSTTTTTTTEAPQPTTTVPAATTTLTPEPPVVVAPPPPPPPPPPVP
ncbi:RNA polymerase sigma factor, partial [Ilumatobacter sp.]|uniref:RNA polymerase sigma factor n=1 Tax=Ilumatobacter sp. TaxID=1967498 RepID=UPI003C3B81B4